MTAEPRREDLLMNFSYCGKILSKAGDWIEESRNPLDPVSLMKSHCICPDCLLANFLVEYLEIQKDRRIRRKSIGNQIALWLAGSMGRF